MQVEQYLLKQNGGIPNNKKLPVLIYKQVFKENIKEQFEKSFSSNGWGGQWINGIYNYHHYHSTAHEALGIIDGEAKLIVGGPDGKVVEVESGDIIILPAGTGHCRLNASDDFKVIGAYPEGQEDYDLCTEKDDPEEKKKNIIKVSLPDNDPVQDIGGALKEIWK
jgi:uncharacterized protein YjlB